MSDFAPLVTFIMFTLLEKSSGRELNTATAFTTLSLLGLLSNPINTLLRTIPALHSALACFQRIQKFLLSESRNSHVLPLQISTGTSAREIVTHGDIELDNLHQNTTNDLMLDVRNASFAWSRTSSPIVSDISFSQSHGQFLFIIGPVGCGKSTLLKGIMGETPSSQGFVYSNMKEFAFIDQTPWIQNITIRQNIIGQSLYQQSWYEEVLQTCALEHDIAGIPKGDGTSKFYPPF